MPTSAGEIVLVRVSGDLDLTSVHVLAAALAQARARRPGHLVVDVAGLGFCSVHGLSMLSDGRADATVTRYVLSGARPHIRHYLNLLWQPEDLPVLHPGAGSAVLFAMSDQLARRTAVERATHPLLRAVADTTEVSDDVTDLQLTRQARAGDSEAYRELARRHRARMYRSAMQVLGAAADPADVAQDLQDDIAARLRTALAAFAAAGPP